MKIEEIFQGNYRLFRVWDSQANEYIYIIQVEGELIFLQELEPHILDTFYGQLKKKES